jgi:hypothetical protein
MRSLWWTGLAVALLLQPARWHEEGGQVGAPSPGPDLTPGTAELSAHGGPLSSLQKDAVHRPQGSVSPQWWQLACTFSWFHVQCLPMAGTKQRVGSVQTEAPCINVQPT